jgi:hypothetical protein
MRKNVLISLIATLFVISTSVASALSIDANLDNIVVGPSPASDPLGDLVIDPSGDSATATLSAGNVVSITITVANPDNTSIAGIFVSLVTDGPQVNFLGANPVAPSILEGGTFFDPLALGNVGSGAVKVNSPVQNDGSAGEMWLQALAFGSGNGSDGAGPDNAITLFYSITGATGDDQVAFLFALTPGDGIEDTSQNPINAAMSGVVINPIPEPGTALLMCLGLAGLSAAGRRQS